MFQKFILIGLGEFSVVPNRCRFKLFYVRSIALDIRNTGIYCGAYGVARVTSFTILKRYVQITKFLAARGAAHTMHPHRRAWRRVPFGPLGCTTHRFQARPQLHPCAFRMPEGLSCELYHCHHHCRSIL